MSLLETELPCGRLRYQRWEAEGECRGQLLLLHGLLGWSGQWAAAATRLAERGYLCLALELPGISSSDRPRDVSLEGLSAWLAAACRALGLEEFVLVGSSWGGALALEFAARSRLAARVRRLVLVAPAHPLWRPRRRQRMMLTPLGARAGAWLGAHASAGVHRALLRRLYGDPRRLPPDSVALYGAQLRQRGLGAAVAGYARRFGAQRRRLRMALARIRVPALLLWGDHDVVVPRTSAAALRQALPQARLTILPGLGHLPFLEDPDAFVAAVAPFLD